MYNSVGSPNIGCAIMMNQTPDDQGDLAYEEQNISFSEIDNNNGDDLARFNSSTVSISTFL
jgi:hypothetical protein